MMFNRNKIALALVPAMLAILALAVQESDASLQNIISEKEAETRAIADRAQALFAGKCGLLSKCKPSECSMSAEDRTTMVPQCGNEPGPGMECTEALGKPSPDTCKGCSQKSQKLDFTEGYLRLPLGAKSQAQLGLAAESACWMRGLSDVFVKNDKARQSAGTLRAWQYFGSHSAGVTNMYPGSQGAYARTDKEGCGNYDPRRRPWYVAASSGPKDIILVLDTSGSMGATDSSGTTRLELMQAAGSAVLDTLTQNDFVSVVRFEYTASVLQGSSRLQRATPEKIKSLQESLSQTLASGGTKFIPALQLAKQLFDASTVSNDASSGCQKVIVFLTDGIDSSIKSGNSFTSSWNTVVQDLSNSRITVVSFSLSNDADDSGPRNVACDTGGVWSRIDDATNPTAAMTSYYELLAQSVRTPNTVAWSSPYEDAGGLGTMVSVAMPVYSLDELVGVASTDVLISELEQFGNYNTVLNSLISQSQSCPDFRNVGNFTCAAERLRVASQCPGASLPSGCSATEGATCSAISLNDVSCSKFDSNTLKNDDGGWAKLNKVYCCGCPALSRGAIAGIVIGGVVFIAVLSYVFWKKQVLCCKHIKGRSQKTPTNAPNAETAVPMQNKNNMFAANQQVAPAQQVAIGAAPTAAYNPASQAVSHPAVVGAVPAATAPAYPGPSAPPAYPQPPAFQAA